MTSHEVGRAIGKSLSFAIMALFIGFVVILIAVFSLRSHVRANPCDLHGGPGTWPWYSDRPAGVVICADNTTWRVYTPPTQGDGL